MKLGNVLRVVMGLGMLVALPALAGTNTWTGLGGDGAWSNPNNWSPTNRAPGAGDRAIFISGQGGTCTVYGIQQVGSLAGTGMVNLAGGDLYVGYDNSSTLFAGVISGDTNSLYKEGTGALILSGASTYGRNYDWSDYPNPQRCLTKIEGGTLTVNGKISSANVWVNPGTTLNGNGLVAGDDFYGMGCVLFAGGTVSGSLAVSNTVGGVYAEIQPGGTLGGNVSMISMDGGSLSVDGGATLRGSHVVAGMQPPYLAAGSAMIYDLTNASAVGLTSDWPLSINGATLAVSLGFVPTIGAQYTAILSTKNGWYGAGNVFANAWDGSLLTATYNSATYYFRVHYNFFWAVSNSVAGAYWKLSSVDQPFLWQGTGSWNTPANWNPNGVPGPFNDAVFVSGQGGPCTVPDGTVVGSVLGTNATLNLQGAWTVGGNDISTEFAGLIQDAPGCTGKLVKAGAGTLTLSRPATYGRAGGATIVSNGTLTVNGGLACSTLSVLAGGTLNGTGTLAGALVNVQVASGGTLRGGSASGPGTLLVAPTNHATASIAGTVGGANTLNGSVVSTNCDWNLLSGARLTGVLTCNGGLVTFSPGVTMTFDLYGQMLLTTNYPVPLTASAIAGASFGNLYLPTNNWDWSAAPPIGKSFTVIRYLAPANQALPGAFDNAPDGAVIVNLYGYSGYTNRVNYCQANYHGADGNDLVLTIPQGPAYSWTAGGTDQNWSTTANWNPGTNFPHEADTANFTGTVSRTVNLGGGQAVYNFNVADSAAWNWTNTYPWDHLTVKSSFNYGNPTTSVLNVNLSGTMVLNVSNGTLQLSCPSYYASTGNSDFKGAINVKGATLAAAKEGINSGQCVLGDPTNVVTLGDTSGSADTTLELYGANGPAVYPQPIVIGAGNSGRTAIIGSKYDNGDNQFGIQLSGGITLNKELTIANHAMRCFYNDRRILQISQNITGAGNLTKEGIGTVMFDGVVTSIVVTAGGSGYTNAPTVVIPDGVSGGHWATATATINGGTVTSVSVTSGGHYYSSAPAVAFTNGGGSGAAATASISGTNFNYAGALTVKDGWLQLYGGAQYNTGDIHVNGGVLGVNRDALLGNAANNLTLGSPGRVGWLAANDAWLTTSRALTLNGNGGLTGQQSMTLNGPISGRGALLLNGSGTMLLNADSSYAGGTRAIWGYGFAQNNKHALGSGNVVVDKGVLVISGGSSMNAGAKVLVKSYSADNSQIGGTVGYFGMPANIATVPAIDPNSSGILAFYGTSDAAVKQLLAGPVGNGYMFIGAGWNSGAGGQDFTFNGSALATGAGNTYRFAPRSVIWLPTSVLTNNGAAPANVLCGSLADWNNVANGSWLVSQAAQTFSGTLSINRSWCRADGLASGSALGAASGAINLLGCLRSDGGGGGALYMYRNGVSGSAISKGTLTYEGSPRLELDSQGAADTLTLTVAALNRASNACLQIWSRMNNGADLGGRDRLVVTAPPVEASGMVAPYFTVQSDGTAGNPEFADYTICFTNVIYRINGAPGTVGSQGNFNSTIPNDIVKVAGTDVALSGNKTVYALKTDSQLTGAGNTLTLSRGGMILTGDAKTQTVNLSSPGELVVNVGGNSAGNIRRNTLNGTIAVAGLTKDGAGTLILGADNSATLAGDITVNEGALEVTNDNAFGASACRIVLNNVGGGWTDGLRLIGNTSWQGVTLPTNRTIYLGNNGGQLYTWYGDATINGKITGPGDCYSGVQAGVYITNPTNDYAGGTVNYNWIYLNGGQLGTGPVYAGSPVNILDNLYHPNRFILGNNGGGSSLRCTSPGPSIGSLEGGAAYGGAIGVFLDTPGCMLTLGGNNASTEFYGPIMEYDDGWGNVGGCGLVKAGTGTFTAWGRHCYTGPTIVSNGTLVVNDWINTNGVVMVRAGATLDGVGTVGVVSNFGGTIQGSLCMRRLSLDASSRWNLTLGGTNAVSQFGKVTVTEGVTLAGTLFVTLNFMPQGGETFKILNNTSAAGVSGQFANGGTLHADYGGRSYTLRVNTAGGDGNDIVLTALPQGTMLRVW